MNKLYSESMLRINNNLHSKSKMLSISIRYVDLFV